MNTMILIMLSLSKSRRCFVDCLGIMHQMIIFHRQTMFFSFKITITARIVLINKFLFYQENKIYLKQP